LIEEILYLSAEGFLLFSEAKIHSSSSRIAFLEINYRRQPGR
jgi:hypothetical protein